MGTNILSHQSPVTHIDPRDPAAIMVERISSMQEERARQDAAALAAREALGIFTPTPPELLALHERFAKLKEKRAALLEEVQRITPILAHTEHSITAMTMQLSDRERMLRSRLLPPYRIDEAIRSLQAELGGLDRYPPPLIPQIQSIVEGAIRHLTEAKYGAATSDLNLESFLVSVDRSIEQLVSDTDARGNRILEAARWLRDKAASLNAERKSKEEAERLAALPFSAMP